MSRKRERVESSDQGIVKAFFSAPSSARWDISRKGRKGFERTVPPKCVAGVWDNRGLACNLQRTSIFDTNDHNLLQFIWGKEPTR
jgi:hypothetical protein